MLIYSLSGLQTKCSVSFKVSPFPSQTKALQATWRMAGHSSCPCMHNITSIFPKVLTAKTCLYADLSSVLEPFFKKKKSIFVSLLSKQIERMP